MTTPGPDGGYGAYGGHGGQHWQPGVPAQGGPPPHDPYATPRVHDPYAAPRELPAAATDRYTTYGYGPPPVVPAALGNDGLAVPALVLGLLGITCFSLAAPVALVLGIVSLRRIGRSGAEGRGLAIAGIVLGAVGTVLFVAALAFLGYVATMGAW